MFALANRSPPKENARSALPVLDDRADYPVPASSSKAKLAREFRTAQ
jgi:hypothetical protein